MVMRVLYTGGKVVLSPAGVLAKGLCTTRYDYADVARLGEVGLIGLKWPE